MQSLCCSMPNQSRMCHWGSHSQWVPQELWNLNFWSLPSLTRSLSQQTTVPYLRRQVSSVRLKTTFTMLAYTVAHSFFTTCKLDVKQQNTSAKQYILPCVQVYYQDASSCRVGRVSLDTAQDSALSQCTTTLYTSHSDSNNTSILLLGINLPNTTHLKLSSIQLASKCSTLSHCLPVQIIITANHITLHFKKVYTT